MPLVVDDVAEVMTITNVFPMSSVLRYPLTHVIVSQASIAASQG
jgi:hypothetical protein